MIQGGGGVTIARKTHTILWICDCMFARPSPVTFTIAAFANGISPERAMKAVVISLLALLAIQTRLLRAHLALEFHGSVCLFADGSNGR
jgi:hypothetical protein